MQTPIAKWAVPGIPRQRAYTSINKSSAGMSNKCVLATTTQSGTYQDAIAKADCIACPR